MYSFFFKCFLIAKLYSEVSKTSEYEETVSHYVAGVSSNMFLSSSPVPPISASRNSFRKQLFPIVFKTLYYLVLGTRMNIIMVPDSLKNPKRSNSLKKSHRKISNVKVSVSTGSPICGLISLLIYLQWGHTESSLRGVCCLN